jgi:hypothetical protein
MINMQNFRKRSLRFYFGMAFAAVVLLALPKVWAQYPLQYPTIAQITKDGTAILLEDYATPPLSSIMMDHPYPPPIDYRGQLARVNSMRSEPTNAPLASTRFFVADMNGNLYILDKATKKFTPYITFAEIFPGTALIACLTAWPRLRSIRITQKTASFIPYTRKILQFRDLISPQMPRCRV